MNVVNQIELVPINKIKPYERNARKNSETVDKLVQIIPRVGFNVPIVLDRNNVIVKGHTRFRAAIKLGMAAIPCVYTDADAETVKLDRLADNKIHEFSQWDNDLLKSELASLELPFTFDLDDLKFNFDLQNIIPPLLPPEPPQAAAYGGYEPTPPEYQTPAHPAVKGQTNTFINECPQCGYKV